MKDKKLKELIRSMDLPSYRKDKFTKNNLEWLYRNMAVRNSGHKSFSEAVALIMEMLENGNYTS